MVPLCVYSVPTDHSPVDRVLNRLVREARLVGVLR